MPESGFRATCLVPAEREMLRVRRIAIRNVVEVDPLLFCGTPELQGVRKVRASRLLPFEVRKSPDFLSSGFGFLFRQLKRIKSQTHRFTLAPRVWTNRNRTFGTARRSSSEARHERTIRWHYLEITLQGGAKPYFVEGSSSVLPQK